MINTYYYFYDLNEVLIDRYPAKIANKIRNNEPASNFVFIYSEKHKENYPSKLPKGSKVFFMPSLNEEKINQIILEFPPNSLTTIAQRIPDMWMLTLFNHKKIPTNIVQHGLWSDKLQRVSFPLLVIQKFSKFISYSSYTFKICNLNKIPYIGVLIDLYNFLLKEDVTIPETKYLNKDMIRANKVFAFDQSWDDYYTKKYGYNINALIYIGNPDFLLLKDIDITKKENSVCYLCQSLVEDGRLPKDIYINFLKKLANSIPSSKKLYIKLHPRSKIKFYKDLNKYQNIVFTKDLPICEYYVAHYTGLLATVKQITDNVLIWLLPNHHTPEYFRKFGSIVSSCEKDLYDFVNDEISFKIKSKPMEKNIEKYFNDFDPIGKISQTLIFNKK